MFPSTPACAGLTRSPASPTPPQRLYPRVRGADGSVTGYDLGLRPSTPACAGLTFTSSSRPGTLTLYPRVRGADAEAFTLADVERPLPPRARG